MNVLARVFHGRVGKSDSKRPTTGQSPGIPSTTSPRSPRRRASKTSRPASGLARPLPNPLGRPPQSGPDLDNEVPVKQEHDQDESLTMGLRFQGDGQDDIDEPHDNHSGYIDENALQDELDDEAELIQESIDEEQVEGEGDFDDDAPEDDKLEGDVADDSQALPVEKSQSPSNSLSSDDPISSIEGDDEDQEEKDQDGDEYMHYDGRPRKKATFLHGKDQLRKVDNPQGEVDDDFEAELDGEREDDLIIHEADLRDWLRHKRATIGVDQWPIEACRLYKLLFLRGLYPIMPWHWAQNLNVIAAIPFDLFTPRNVEGKALITADRSAYSAEKALRQLFELWTRVGLLRGGDRHDYITRLVARELKQFIRWAERDGEFLNKLDYVSPCVIVPYTNARDAANGKSIVQRCQDVVQKYRDDYADRNIENYPRMIYIFVVIQHVVVVMAADTTEVEVEEEPYPLAELDVSKQSHWLDSTLGIAIPVMLARQSLVAHRKWFPEVPPDSDEET